MSTKTNVAVVISDHQHSYASLCAKSFGTKLLTSTKHLNWKCLRWEKVWKESVSKRKRYVWCPECQTRKERLICVDETCKRMAYYNFPQLPWRNLCSKHKQKGMVYKYANYQIRDLKLKDSSKRSGQPSQQKPQVIDLTLDDTEAAATADSGIQLQIDTLKSLLKESRSAPPAASSSSSRTNVLPPFSSFDAARPRTALTPQTVNRLVHAYRVRSYQCMGLMEDLAAQVLIGLRDPSRIESTSQQ